MQDQLLEIGKIVSIQGLKGEVRVQPWCDGAEFVCEFDCLYRKDGTALPVQNARVSKGMAIVHFEGVDTPEQAEALRGVVLYLNRADVELEEGTYFIQDLLGMNVVDADSGISYGELTDVMQTGANDVYEIRQGERSVLIPAIADVVIETNIPERIMKIRPLKGLFDDAD